MHSAVTAEPLAALTPHLPKPLPLPPRPSAPLFLLWS